VSSNGADDAFQKAFHDPQAQPPLHPVEPVRPCEAGNAATGVRALSQEPHSFEEAGNGSDPTEEMENTERAFPAGGGNGCDLTEEGESRVMPSAGSARSPAGSQVLQAIVLGSPFLPIAYDQGF